ncbi:hypothetical protein D3C75_782600 [compost metagenome]
MALDHFALAHVQNLHAHPALVHGIAEYIAVFRIRSINLLLLHQGIDVDNLITQFLGAFEVQLLRSLLHFLLQVLFDRFMSSPKERGDIARYFIIS